MHLFQAGVDMAVIALWLGHESLETTHVYVEADLATKERALEKLAPMPVCPPATAPTTNSWRSWQCFDYAALITSKGTSCYDGTLLLGITRSAA
jgi:hypothetical protein